MDVNGGTEDALPPGMKRCTRCGEPQLITNFYAGRRKKTDPPNAPRIRMSWCKDCHKGYTKARRNERLLKEGDEFLAAESERVAKHTRQPQIAADRAAAAKAVRRADAQLRRLHPQEYQLLLAQARQEEGLESPVAA